MISERLRDELEVLAAIYSPDKVKFTECIPSIAGASSDKVSSAPYHELQYQSTDFMIKLSIPCKYPSIDSAVSVYWTYPDLHLTRSVYDRIASHRGDTNTLIEQTQQDHQGEEVLFQLIELVRSSVDQFINEMSSDESPEAEQTISSQNDAESDQESYLTEINEVNNQLYENIRERKDQKRAQQSSNVEVIHGEVTVERKSSFQSHFARVKCMQDVQDFREIVLSDSKVGNY